MKVGKRTCLASRFAKLLLIPALVLTIGLGSSGQNQPDLQVTTPLTVEPGSVERGDPVMITVEISNESPVPVETSFDVIFQLRSDGTTRDLDPDQLTCLNFPNEQNPARCTITGLAAVGEEGARVQVRARLDTTRLEPSQYTIVAIADPDRAVTEANENNNSGEGLLLVRRRLPNLTILADFGLSPSRPQQGDLLTIAFTIENDRPADVATPFAIELAFRKRGEIAFEELRRPALSCPACTVLGLGAGERKTIEAQIATILLEPADYQLRIMVDPPRPGEGETVTGQIEEADESDNVLTVDFVLAPPPRNLTLSGGRLSPQPPALGSPVSLSFMVTNESFVAAEGVALGFSLQHRERETSIDLRTLPGFACGPRQTFELERDQCRALRLAADESLEVLVQFSPADLVPGDYELRAVVDPENEIVEIDEEDNLLTVRFSLVEEAERAVPRVGPELHPTQIRFVPSSPVVQGQLVIASVLIVNSGNRDANSFGVEFSLRREDAQAPQSFVRFGMRTVEGLKLGKSVEKSSVLDTADLEPGLYAIRVEVDAQAQAELDVNNNVMIAFLTVIKPQEGS